MRQGVRFFEGCWIFTLVSDIYCVNVCIRYVCTLTCALGGCPSAVEAPQQTLHCADSCDTLAAGVVCDSIYKNDML